MEIKKIEIIEISDLFYPVHVSLEIPSGNDIYRTVLNVASWFDSSGIEKENTVISVLYATIKQPIANLLVEPEITALIAAIMKNLLNPLRGWAGQKINLWVGQRHVIQLSDQRKVIGIYEVIFAPDQRKVYENCIASRRV